MRLAATGVLSRHLSLTERDTKSLITLLGDLDRSVQFAIGEAFGSQLVEHFPRDPDTFRHSLVESLYSQYTVRQNYTNNPSLSR